MTGRNSGTPANATLRANGYAKVYAMPHIDGETLRAWRRSRGWDVPETGRRLGHAAADGQVPVHDAPVLELPPELRIQTVTGYLDEIGEMLAAPRFDGSALGVGPRQQISEFNASPV